MLELGAGDDARQDGLKAAGEALRVGRQLGVADGVGVQPLLSLRLGGVLALKHWGECSGQGAPAAADLRLDGLQLEVHDAVGYRRIAPVAAVECFAVDLRYRHETRQ